MCVACSAQHIFCASHLARRRSLAFLAEMEAGKLVRRPPVGRGVRDGVVNVADYETGCWKCVPIAIPSKVHEQVLRKQTL